MQTRDRLIHAPPTEASSPPINKRTQSLPVERRSSPPNKRKKAISPNRRLDLEFGKPNSGAAPERSPDAKDGTKLVRNRTCTNQIHAHPHIKVLLELERTSSFSKATVPSSPERYSLRKASTGSFFAARRAGMMPAIRVRSMLMTTRIAPPTGGRAARV